MIKTKMVGKNQDLRREITNKGRIMEDLIKVDSMKTKIIITIIGIPIRIRKIKMISKMNGEIAHQKSKIMEVM
jgi:hypothetical protein